MVGQDHSCLSSKECILPTCFLRTFTASVDFPGPAPAMHRATSYRIPDHQDVPAVPCNLTIDLRKAAACDDRCRYTATHVPDVDCKDVFQDVGPRCVIEQLKLTLRNDDNRMLGSNELVTPQELGRALLDLAVSQHQQLHHGTMWVNILPMPMLHEGLSRPSFAAVSSPNPCDDTSADVWEEDPSTACKWHFPSCQESVTSNHKIPTLRQVLPKFIEQILSQPVMEAKPWQCSFVPEPIMSDVWNRPSQAHSSPGKMHEDMRCGSGHMQYIPVVDFEDTVLFQAALDKIMYHLMQSCTEEQWVSSVEACQHVAVELRVKHTTVSATNSSTCPPAVECVITVLCGCFPHCVADAPGECSHEQNCYWSCNDHGNLSQRIRLE